MSPQDKCILSLYRETEPLGDSDKVMLVRHTETGQLYVKKTLSAYSRDVYRFLAQAAIRGIPRIYNCIDDGDRIIVIEEYIRGQTLREYMTDCGILPEKTACRIGIGLCDILERLHKASAPIVCRDLKPENIILSEDGQIYVIDFDSAKFVRRETSDTVLLGTPGYAAPEQFGFAASDERTDVYAVGVILNEMLTGHLPQEQTARGSIGKAIARCVSLDPKARPKTIGEVRYLLGGRRLLPPGFRTGSPVNMFIGTVGYILAIAWVIYVYVTESQNEWSSSAKTRISMPLLFLAIIIWSIAYGFDYAGIRRNTIIGRKIRKRSTRAVLYGIIWILGLILISWIWGLIMVSLR